MGSKRRGIVRSSRTSRAQSQSQLESWICNNGLDVRECTFVHEDESQNEEN